MTLNLEDVFVSVERVPMCVCPNADRGDAFSPPSDKGEIKRPLGELGALCGGCQTTWLPREEGREGEEKAGPGAITSILFQMWKKKTEFTSGEQTSPAGLIGAVSMRCHSRGMKRA